MRLVDNIQRWVLGRVGGGWWGWASSFAGVASRGVCVCVRVACGAAVGLRARVLVLSSRASRGHGGCGLPVSRGVAVFVWRVFLRPGSPSLLAVIFLCLQAML